MEFCQTVPTGPLANLIWGSTSCLIVTVITVRIILISNTTWMRMLIWPWGSFAFVFRERGLCGCAGQYPRCTSHPQL